jgi:hypothetical protein
LWVSICSEAKLRGRKRVARYEEKKSLLGLFVACGDPKVSGRDSSLVVRVVKRDTNTASEIVL